jgi:hypothetical protein
MSKIFFVATAGVADPDPTYQFDADPSPYFYLMRIWILIFI